MTAPKTVIIITGPTASGKTELAIRVAKHFCTSIISADSRQCFRELNIGVAKPSATQLQDVRHHFINSHSIHEEVNAAIFESLALKWCEEIFSSHDIVVMVGGTGLYIRAFRDGLDEIPVISEGIRSLIAELYQEKGIQGLRDLARDTDPDYFAGGEIANPQRLMRALEVIKSTGRSILTFQQKQKKQRPFNIIEFALRVPRNELYKRINERVDRMISEGLLDEVKSLFPYRHLNALQTVGYSELFEFLEGKAGLDESISRIKQNTRHYAKRQVTWLNKNKELTWLDADYMKNLLNAVREIKT
jgi:tRNA dimethylallyltransferase